MILPTFTILLVQILASQCEVINDPSLKPADSFSADDDAKAIRKQMVKTLAAINRDKICDIFFHKTFNQRAAIEQCYNHKFCCDKDAKKCPFHSALKDISTEAMEMLYNDALIAPPELLAIWLNNIITGTFCEIGAIEEIVCANDKRMKDGIDQAYYSYYSTTVEDELKNFKNEDHAYQKVMLNYCWKGLSQDKKITPQDVDKEVQALRKINYKTDKLNFIKLLTELLDKYSEPDLKQIFQKYRNDKDGIDDAVNEAFEVKRVKRAYSTLVRYIEDTCKFYSGQLHDTVDNSLTWVYRIGKINRIILSRCERDLLCIFNKYKELHDGKTFTNHLKVNKFKKLVNFKNHFDICSSDYACLY